MTKEKRNQWHPAFYGAMHLELKDNKDDLEFTEELILNTMPLRVDLLIVKKTRPCVIKNEIGKIFGTHNLLEFKSPNTPLNYDVFLKGIAYAYLYKSNERYVGEIELEDVTLSFIRQRKPIKLFQKLKTEKFHIEEKWKGIYYISKEATIRIQIIVSKELSSENHIWLNALSEGLNLKQTARLIEKTQKLQQLDDKNYADSLWEIVANVNEKIVQKAKEDNYMCEALARIMKPEIDKAAEEGFNNGYDDGYGKGMCENIFSLLEDLGEITDELKDAILAQKDVSKLKAWTKIAARAASIEDFVEKIQG